MVTDARSRRGPSDLPPGVPLYVYAVTPARASRSARELKGVEDAPLGTVASGGLAVVVSPFRGDRVRPTRANLAAHQQVVEELHRQSPVLPVRFGTVLPGEEAVIAELLGTGAAGLESLLGDLDGKDEYRVKARYLPDVALREVVEGSRAIRDLRGRSRGSDRAAQMRLGELVMAGLEQLRERDAEEVLERLAPHAAATRLLDTRSEDVVAHLALLAERTRAEALEQALEALIDEQRGRMQLELVGPLPAWDFSYLEASAT